MTNFYIGNRRLQVYPSIDIAVGGFIVLVEHVQKGNFEAITLPVSDAPAVAAAVLEAAGVELDSLQAKMVEAGDKSAYYPDSLKGFLASALVNLRMHQKVAEYHAKPKVTPSQRNSVFDALEATRQRHPVAAGNPADATWSSALVEELVRRGWTKGETDEQPA